MVKATRIPSPSKGITLQSKLMSHPPNHQMIYVEGNIGSGKTYLLRILEGFECHVIPEDLDLWDHSSTAKSGLLQSYFRIGGGSTAEHFQNVVAANYLIQDHRARKLVGPVYQERSIQACLDVFLPQLHVNQQSRERMSSYIQSLADRISSPAYIIFLETPLQVCWERVQKRNRPGEAPSVSLAYLASLQENYKNLLRRMFDLGIPIVPLAPGEIDGDILETIRRKLLHANICLATGDDRELNEILQGNKLRRSPAIERLDQV